MGAVAVDSLDRCAHGHFPAVDADRIHAFEQAPTQSMFGLEADEEHGGALFDSVVDQMVQDAAAFAHAGGADDHRGTVEGVQALRIVRASIVVQPIEAQRILVLVGRQRLEHLLVVALRVDAHDIRDVDRQRAVHVDIDAGQATFHLELVQAVHQLLRPPERERRDQELAAAFERLADRAKERGLGLPARLVLLHAIRTLHDHVVRPVDDLRILDDRHAATAYIAGEDETPFRVALRDVKDHARRAQDVAGEHEVRAHAADRFERAVKVDRDEAFERFDRVPRGVERFEGRLAVLLPIAIDELDVVLLNVGGIQEHVGAEIARCRSGVDRPVEAVAHQRGQIAAVVDVRVRKDDRVDLARVERQVPIALECDLSPSLEHPAIQEQVEAVGVHQVHRSGDGARCTPELDVHRGTPRREGRRTMG